MEKICVAVRLRPPSGGEISDSPSPYWKIDDSRISLIKPAGTLTSRVSYAYDHIFDQDCKNVRVYELLTKDIIRAALDGINGTAFAYGQTSSGKTYTINGSDDDPGIIHLAVEDIFKTVKMMNNREFLIRVSYMEIYNEEINDLFAPENHKLQIHENLERGIFVAGLQEEIVDNAEQVLKLIAFGEVNRHFGQTNLNVRSSRSHTIFRMVIESRGKDASDDDVCSTDAIRVSVLNLVDLAGSERIAKTGAGGVRLKEGKYINKSLMVLGNVINRLSDGKQRAHIPYRDSKLTRILQSALGGNAKTSIICTIAPEKVHIEETRGTLLFANRAKRISNCVQVNEILTDATLLKRQKLEIEELRKQLQGSCAEDLEQEILKLRNEMLKYELEHEKLAMELAEERKSHKEREEQIREQNVKLDNSRNFTSNYGRSVMQSRIKESVDNQGMWQGNAFRTPNFKAIRKGFVTQRSTYSSMHDSGPPASDAFVDVADEDTWLRLNKGHTTDLDSIQMTPMQRYQLEQSIDASDRNNKQQLYLNNQLKVAISELRQELLLIREIPQRLCESVITCKETYEDIISIIQRIATDKSSHNTNMLSSMHDIGSHLFSTLEIHLSTALNVNQENLDEYSSSISEQCKDLMEKVKSAVSNIEPSQALNPSPREKNSRKPQEVAALTGSHSYSFMMLSLFFLLSVLLVLLSFFCTWRFKLLVTNN